MAGILRRIERQLGRGTRSGVETTRPIPEAVGDRNSVEENMGTDGQTAGNKEPIMEVLQAENCAVSLEPSEVDPKLGFEMQGPRLTYSDILVNETKPRIDPSPKPGEEKRVSLHLSGQYDSYQDNNSQILTSSGATSTDRSAVRLPVETESPEKVESSDNTRKAMAEKLVAYLATQGGCSQDKCADVQQLEDGETCAHITPTVYAIEDCQDEQGKKIHHITENLRNVQNDLVEESQSDTAFEITFEEPKHTPVTTAVVRITTQAPSETPAVSSSPPLITQSDPKQIKAKSMLTPFFDHWKETMARPEKGRIGHPAMPHVDKAPRNESRPTKVKSRLTPAFFAQRSASLGVSSRTPIRLPAISQSPNRRLGDVHKEKSELKEETRESNPRPMKAKSRFTPEFFVERKAALAVTQPGGICIPTILEISKHPGEEVEQLETNGVSESSPRTETTLYSSETTISDPSKVAAADDYKVSKTFFHRVKVDFILELSLEPYPGIQQRHHHPPTKQM